MLTTTWDRIAALRLARQHLDRPAPHGALHDVVGALVAVQAQVMSSAELALGTRVAGLTPDDVRRALWQDRSLVKTWAMRGTLHLVAAHELPELVAALGTRMDFLRPIWLRRFGVSAEDMARLQASIGEVLSATPITRATLIGELADRLGDPSFADRAGGGWGTFLKPAAGRGELCFGPDAGRNVTFVSPAAWLGRDMPDPDPAAVAAIIERHLASFPGSSRAELARWWGVSGRDLQDPLAALGDRLSAVIVDGTRGYARTADLDALATIEPAPGIRLLATFDPYTLSLQKEAEPLLPLRRRPLVARQAGWISAVVLDAGRVCGTWTHEVTAAGVRVRVSPWRRLSRDDRRRIEAEAVRVGRFLAPASEVRLAIMEPA
jgi:hypothetical protein